MALYIGSTGHKQFQELLSRAPTDLCLGAAVEQIEGAVLAHLHASMPSQRSGLAIAQLILDTGNSALIEANIPKSPDQVTAIQCRNCGHCALAGLDPAVFAFQTEVQLEQMPCHVIYELPVDVRRQALSPPTAAS